MAAPMTDSKLLISEIEDSPVPSYTALVFKDGTRRIIQLNYRLLSLLHLSREDVQEKGFSLTPFIHPKDLDRINSSIQRAMATLSPWHEEFMVVRRDGSEVRLEGIGSVTKQDEESALFHMVFIDISARESKTKITTAREDLENLANLTNTGHFTILVRPDHTSSVVYANDYFLRITGLDAEEIKADASRISRVVHPEDYERLHEELYRTMPEYIVFHGEFRVIHGKGIRWLEFYQKPVIQPDHSLKLYGIVVDITERKLLEEKAETLRKIALESESHYKSIAESIEDPLVVVNEENRFLFVNNSAAAILGYTREDVMSLPPQEIFDKKTNETRLEKIKETLRTNQTTTDEISRMIHGEKKWYRRTYTPMIRVGEKPVVMIIAVDITKEHHERELLEKFNAQLEQKVEERTVALREALQKQKEYSDLQAQFIATTSHEFRTPLAVISLATGFIRRYSHLIEDEKLKEKLQVIDWQVSKMAILLEEILTIQKSEKGFFSCTLSMHSLGTIVKGALNETSSMLSGRVNLLLQQKTDEVLTDQQLLHLILTNLVSNALKFSPADSVVTMVVSNPDESHFSIAVTDNGIGIPCADLERIFLPFMRSANATTVQGTGLGLAIVKRAVDTLEGKIEVTSEVGKGTTVTVVFPISPSQKPDR
ncbi:MAG: PAS domain S-box protein [Bacteroidetes bacterium]|nr:PAS domain S-box protein [Bacteroidota bacterium]